MENLTPEQMALLNNLWALVSAVSAQVEIRGLGTINIGLAKPAEEK